MYKTYTQFSRIRFNEIKNGMRDGSLRKYWDEKDLKILSKRDEVEERQIKGIALILTSAKETFELLEKNEWKKAILLRDEELRGTDAEFRIKIFKR